MLTIVYTGAMLGGSSTNLEVLCKLMQKKAAATLHELAAEDYGEYKGLVLKWRLPAISEIPPTLHNEAIKIVRPAAMVCHCGCHRDNYQRLVAGLGAHRQQVFRNSDGMVFVADSLPYKKDVNIEAWKEICPALAEKAFPIVLQYNKRDMPDAVPVELLHRALNPHNQFPESPAVAVHGKGVWETFIALLQQIATTKTNQQEG